MKLSRSLGSKLNSLKNFLRCFLANLAVFALVFEQFLFVFASTSQAAELPITPDGSTNTQVTKTASGIDQVNIAAPDSSGLSHNKFSDYNVNQSGQIINNFSGQNSAEVVGGSGSSALTSTQIGGLVTVNQNLVNSGSARVILNEVTSGNVSKLLGYTEIAGTKADLILANPNGIACFGCGFINTAHLMMVGGSSNFDANGNLGFNLKEQSNPNLYVPLITVDGLGLDVTRNTSTEIIASSIKLLSTIYGSNSNSVALKAGEGRYDYNSQSLTPNSSLLTPIGDQPLFAIDASSLSKIQAGNIYLIATKQGVGVKMEGEILASSTVNIDANGDVYYSNIAAGDEVNLKSSQKLTSVSAYNSSNLSSDSSSIFAPTINIKASEFTNYGLALANNLNLINGGTINNFGSLKALNLSISSLPNNVLSLTPYTLSLNNSGLIFGQNSLNISGSNLTNSLTSNSLFLTPDSATPTIYSPVDYNIILTGLLTNSGFIGSGNNLTVNSNQLANNNEISAKNNLTFAITTSAANSGKLIATQDLNVTTNSLTNSGQINSGGVSIFNLSSLTNNQNSSIYSDNTLTLNLYSSLLIPHSSLLINSGSISSQNDLTISGTSNITNFNKILSNGDINISAVSLINNEDAIISALTKSLTATLSGNLQNDGNLNSATDLTLSSNSFNNSGNIFGYSNVNLTSSDLDNAGSITAVNTLTLNANDLINSNLIQSGGSSNINLTGTLTNAEDALIYSTSNLTLSATNSLSNSGEISTASSANISSSSLNNSSKILANNALTISSSNSFDNSGILSAQGSVVINSAILTSNSGILNSGSSLNISSENLSNQGQISSLGSLKISDVGTITNSNQILSNGALIISAQNLTSSPNKITDPITNLAIASLENSLTLNISNQLTNSGQLSSVSDLTIAANNFTNNSNANVLSGAKLDVRTNAASNSSSNSITNSGSFQSVETTILNSASLTNSGTIKSFGTSTININSITNQANAVIFSNYDLTINSSLLTPNSSVVNSGSILSNANLNITSGTTTNNNQIYSASKLTLNLSGTLTNLGSLSSLKELMINSNSSISNFNEISSLGNLTITATDLTNESRSSAYVKSMANLIMDFGNTDYTITGGFIAHNLSITANNITNHGDVTAAGYISLEATGNNAALGSGNIINGFTATGSGTSNSGVRLAAGSSLNFLAKNNIENYGTISSAADLTLSSTYGNISNYSTGAIGANGDIATINTINGSFNNYGQSSLFIALNDAVFNTKNVNNYGEISTKNNLTINASDSLTNNQSALIWSGGNSEFDVVNNFTNNRTGYVYANDKLTIQKYGIGDLRYDANNNKSAVVNNVSATIATKDGDIFINASNLNNVRDSSDYKVISTNTDSSNNQYEQFDERSAYGWVRGGWWGLTLVRFNVPELAYKSPYSYLISDGAQQDSRIDKTVMVIRAEDPTNLYSKISAGGKMTINADSLNNSSSSISAVENIELNANELHNESRVLSNTINHKCVSGGSCRVYDTSVPQSQWDSQFGKTVKVLSSNQSIQFEVAAAKMIASIKSGRSLKINNSTVLSNSDEIAKNIYVGTISRSLQSNPIENTLAQTGVVSVDLSAITQAIADNSSSTSGSVEDTNDTSLESGDSLVKKKDVTASAATADSTTITSSTSTASTSDVVYSGNFKINLDPASTKPLVESRSQFVDVSKFFGSEYYFNQLGLNGKNVIADIERQTRDPNPKNNSNINNIHILGDSFVENQLITNQLRTISNDSLLLSKSTADAISQVKELLDNSVSELNRLGLNAENVATKGLTTAQANSLTKDIVTFELTSVNGLEVLAPKIYLSQSTRNRLLGSDSALASNSTISAMGDLTINAPTVSLFNSGSIKAGNNLDLNVGSLSSISTNSGSLGTTAISDLAQIKAGNNLSIATNYQSPITSLALSEKSSLTNSSLLTPASSLTLQNTVLSAGNQTSLASLGDISITNDKNLKLTTLSASIPSLSSSNLVFASSIKDDAASSRSALTFNSASDINLTSTGSINIANNYTNTGGSIYMTAANNINNSNYQITASDNVVMEANNINNISTATSASAAISNPTSIEAGNIVSINATKDSNGDGGNINNIGATIKADSLVYLTADNNITNKALLQYNINGATSYSSGLTSSQTAADFTNTTLSSTGTSTSDTNMLNSNANYIRSTLISQGNISAGDSSTGTTGNVVLVAGNNLNNIGSNISSTGSTYLEATNGNINITTAALRDRSVSSWGSRKKGGTTTTDKTTNLQSEISSAGDLEIFSGNNVTLQAAKLISGTDTSSSSSNGDINVTANNNLLLTTATDSYFTHTETKNKGTFTFKNNDRGAYGTTIINNEISAAADGVGTGSLNLNVGNQTYAEFKNGSLEKASATNSDGSVNSSYDSKLSYLKELDASTAIYNPINETHKGWDTTTRGLTQTSQLLIAIAMTAAVIATGGAAAAGAGAATSMGAAAGGAVATGAAAGTAAVASTAATTTTLSATNASMNDSGNFFRSLDDVSKITLKDTTSKQSLENMAIAGLTAALTAGVMKAGGLTPSTTTVNAPTITASVTNTVATAGVGTVANTLVTSAVKGQGLNKSIEEQGGAREILTNTAIVTLAQIGAQRIGEAYHGDTTTLTDSSGKPLTNIDGTTMTTSTIDKATQLTLHGALGCAAASGLGGSCASGAVGAVAGELTAEYAYDKTNGLGLSRESSIALASIASAGASLVTSSLQNKNAENSDEKVAKDVQIGSILGSNAAENNATLVVTGTDPNQIKSSSNELDSEFRKSVEETFNEKLIEFEWTGGNTKEARTEAAHKLYDLFKNYEFVSDEKFNLVGFSHGGNVLKEFTSLYDGEKKIDNMVLLGTPNRPDYNMKLDPTDFSFYANKVSVSDIGDGVQTRGYIDGSVYRGGITIPHDIRMMPGFINVRSNQNLGLINNHIGLPTQKNWDELVKPYLINK